MRRLLSLLFAIAALVTDRTSQDEGQRAWHFQPSDQSWWLSEDAAAGMSDVCIDFASQATRQPVAPPWLAHANLATDPKAPMTLDLHGARFNVVGTVFRNRCMQALGFSVLSMNRRGFGNSSRERASEPKAVDHGRAAGTWLGRTGPNRPRHIVGHSLSGAMAIELAAEVGDEADNRVEGNFTAIPNGVRAHKRADCPWDR